MQRRLAYVGLFALSLALPAGATEWLTVYGFPEVDQGDLVEVDPTPAEAEGMPVVRLRVSRKQVRTSFQGHVYRSYTSTAAIDCARREGWYQSAAYYPQPEWQGEVSARETYASGEAPVRFKDIPGDTAQKIVQAACKLKSVR